MFRGGADSRIAEDVRVTAHHLVRDDPGNLGEVEATGFLGHPRVIDDLKQQVAEFIRQAGEVGASDRIGDFIGLLDRIWRDGLEGLLPVPRAAPVGVS